MLAAWLGPEPALGGKGILYVSPIFLVKCQLWWLIGVYKEPRVTFFAAWLGPETALGGSRLYWTSLEEKLIFLIFLDSLYHQYLQFDASYDDWECERNQGGRVDYWRLVVQWGTTMWTLWIFHETASTDFQCVFPLCCVTFTLGCCLCNWREGNPFGCGTDSPPSQPDSEEHHNHHHNHHHHHRYSLTGKNMAAKQGKILFWKNESLPGHGRGRQGRRSFSDRKSGGCEVGCNDNRVSDVVNVGRASSREGLYDKELR